MAVELNSGKLIATLVIVCSALVLIVMPILVLTYSVHNLVHGQRHYSNWNSTVTSPDYECDVSNEDACCECEIFKYGHCCVEKRDVADKSLACMRSTCSTEVYGALWYYLAGGLAALLLLTILILGVFALTSVCFEKPKSCLMKTCQPCIKKYAAAKGKEEAKDAIATELQELKKDLEDGKLGD